MGEAAGVAAALALEADVAVADIDVATAAGGACARRAPTPATAPAANALVADRRRIGNLSYANSSAQPLSASASSTSPR